MENPTYDVIFIGKGLMGAAAVRHLSGMQSRVALIGPDEPTDWSTYAGIFGSRYDEGRIDVLVGGNGSSAKSADEIGRLGALMITHDEWAYDLESHYLSAQFALAS